MSDSFVDTKLRDKVKWSLPWLLRYPAWRAGEFFNRTKESQPPGHLIFIVANHFEPGLGNPALERLEKWCELARATGDALRDHDGTPFRHTNFFPAEQYERRCWKCSLVYRQMVTEKWRSICITAWIGQTRLRTRGSAVGNFSRRAG